MNKLGRASRSLGCIPLSQGDLPRLGRGFGFPKAILFLIFTLTLVSCDNGVALLGEQEAGSTSPTLTAPADIAVAATNAGGTAATDPAVTAFLDGASAFDPEDGVITAITNDGPAVFPLGGTTVTFSVTDSDGNTSTAQATVMVADQTVPVITLLGPASVTLNVGDLFTDAGATANDDVDGDLTPSIVTGGSVNTAAVGIYTLTYDVSDAAGNAAAQVTRSVSVQDAGAPIVTPLPSITVAAVDATGTAATDAAIVAFLDGATALDAVDGPIAIVTNDAPIQFPLGATTVTFSAVDGSGNTGQAQATVTVSDQAPPVVTPPLDIAVAATSPAGIAETDPAIVAFLNGVNVVDNVDNPVASISNNAPASFPAGVTTPVTFTATDAAGNSSNAQASVTVAPYVPVQKIAFSRDVSGQLDLFAVNEDGTGLITLASNAVESEVFGGATSDNRIVFARTNSADGGNNNIYSISDDGIGVPQALATGPEDELPVAVTSANDVVFMRSLTTPGPHTDLLSIGAGGGTEVPLAFSDDAEFMVALSSDDRVIYQRLVGGSQYDLYSNLADGSGSPMPLADDPGLDDVYGALSGSDVVVFARTLAGPNNNVFTIPAEGMTLEFSLLASGDDELPVDVTDNDLVIFVRSVGTNLVLKSIGISGTPTENSLVAADLFAGKLLSYGGSAPGGYVIFSICDFAGDCDVYSRIADGSVSQSTLSDDPLKSELFAGVSSDGLIIISRDDGVNTELVSVKVDGTDLTPLATAPTPVFPNEVFKGVTENGRVIFQRDIGGQIALFSIKADGSAAEVRLHDDLGDEYFGGIF